MPDDLAGAADSGKHLLILFAQQGCPYCRELHEVNFAHIEISDYMQQHFLVMQQVQEWLSGIVEAAIDG